jgi:hypothetical protein
MTRRWRTWRVLLAVLLLCAAALAFWAWPREPAWRIAEQILRGFDERRGLVYLQNRTDAFRQLPPGETATVILNVHDLATGELITRATCRPRVVDRHVLIPRKGDLLALFSYEKRAFELFALPGGEWLKGIKWAGKEELQAAALSSDGKYLAACTNLGYAVWDVQSGRMLHEARVDLTRPTEPRAFDTVSNLRHVSLSDDGTLLAITTAYGDVRIFDLGTSRELGSIPNSTKAEFTSDGKTVMLANSVRRFHISDGKLQPQDNMNWVPEKDATVVSVDENVVVIGKRRQYRLPFRDSLPSEMVETLECWFGGWSLTFRDPISGAVLEELPMTLPLMTRKDMQRSLAGIVVGRPSETPSALTILNNGQRVIHQKMDSVALWDVPSGRSWLSWIVCCGLVLLAIWIGWPRREKVVAGAHAKA